jgi:hypothetical protein
MGKSFLLRPLAEASGGFYYQALLQARLPALEDFGQKLGAWMGVGPLRFRDWDEAFGAIFGLQGSPQPLTVVIDELPYLLEHSAELPSVLQRLLDESQHGGGQVRLVLCGSALSLMSQLLEGAQALRGRATVDLPVLPFDYRTAAGFWGISDPKTAFLVHAVLGGAPGYRDLVPAGAPHEPGELDDWVMAGVLNPASALFREDDFLLTEARGLTDRALYHSVLVAIAEGAARQSKIAAALGRSASTLGYPLSQLEQTGFIVKAQDPLRQNRPVYRVADPLLRFHSVITRRDIARFEQRLTDEAWRAAAPRFSSAVLGPHFEQLAREFTLRYADGDLVGGTPAIVESTVVNDKEAKQTREVDVVALEVTAAGAKRVCALGEAKHTNEVRGMGDLTRLERIRSLVEAANPRLVDGVIRLLVFSANGFTDELIRTAGDRGDVGLIDLETMYR